MWNEKGLFPIQFANMDSMSQSDITFDYIEELNTL